MTHEPDAASRARFAQAVNLSGVSPDFLAGATGGVTSLSIALRHGLSVLEASTGPTAPIALVQDLISNVAAGLTDELGGHEARLRRESNGGDD